MLHTYMQASENATCEIASGSKLGIDDTRKLPDEDFKHTWPHIIKMDDAANVKSVLTRSSKV